MNYSLMEVRKVLATHKMDPYHRDLMLWLLLQVSVPRPEFTDYMANTYGMPAEPQADESAIVEGKQTCTRSQTRHPLG